MKAMAKLTAAGLAGAAVVAVLSLAIPSASPLAALRWYLLDEPARGADLEDRAAAVRRYDEAKTQVAVDLIHGRLSLPEALAAFDRLDDEHGGPGMDETRVRVMRRVEVVLQCRPAHERERVLARLVAPPAAAATTG